MAKANTSTIMKKPAAAERRKMEEALQKEGEAYVEGCSSGQDLAMLWLSDRKRTLPSVYSACLQHVMLEFMYAYQQPRSDTKRQSIRSRPPRFVVA